MAEFTIAGKESGPPIRRPTPVECRPTGTLRLSPLQGRWLSGFSALIVVFRHTTAARATGYCARTWRCCQAEGVFAVPCAPSQQVDNDCCKKPRQGNEQEPDGQMPARRRRAIQADDANEQQETPHNILQHILLEPPRQEASDLPTNERAERRWYVDIPGKWTGLLAGKHDQVRRRCGESSARNNQVGVPAGDAYGNPTQHLLHRAGFTR